VNFPARSSFEKIEKTYIEGKPEISCWLPPCAGKFLLASENGVCSNVSYQVGELSPLSKGRTWMSSGSGDVDFLSCRNAEPWWEKGTSSPRKKQ